MSGSRTPSAPTVDPAIHLTLYQRTYLTQDAPVSWSLTPFPAHQRHTFAAGGTVYEAEYHELAVVTPDDARIDPVRSLLSWHGDKGAVKSTAREVLELARAGASGFRVAASA